MQIHELSARTTLANTDVVAVDTGSATYKTDLPTLKTAIFSGIGDISSAGGTDSSITFNGTTKQVASLQLSAGSWVISGYARFNGSVSGRQGISIVDVNTDGYFDIKGYELRTTGNSTNNQYYNVSRIVKITSTKTYYLMGYDSSSSARTVNGGLEAMRIA